MDSKNLPARARAVPASPAYSWGSNNLSSSGKKSIIFILRNSKVKFMWVGRWVGRWQGEAFRNANSFSSTTTTIKIKYV